MRKTTWFLVALPWILAALTAASLAWAVPRADDGRPLDGRVTRLQRRISALEEATRNAAARVESLRERTRTMREEREALETRERSTERHIAQLEARIALLKRQAQAEAAREAAAAEQEAEDFPAHGGRAVSPSPTPPSAGDPCEGGECPPE